MYDALVAVEGGGGQSLHHIFNDRLLELNHQNQWCVATKVISILVLELKWLLSQFISQTYRLPQTPVSQVTCFITGNYCSVEYKFIPKLHMRDSSFMSNFEMLNTIHQILPWKKNKHLVRQCPMLGVGFCLIEQKITGAWQYTNQLWDSLSEVHSSNMEAICWAVAEIMIMNQSTKTGPIWKQYNEWLWR